MEADFGETQVLVRLMVDYANMSAKEHALLNRIEAATSEEERQLLEDLSNRNQFIATLLPIRTVGVQVSSDSSFLFKSVDHLLGYYYRETAALTATALDWALTKLRPIGKTSLRMPKSYHGSVITLIAFAIFLVEQSANLLPT